MICHGSVGIGSDRMGSFVDFDPYYAQVLQLLHISKIACLIPGQNSFSRAMRTVSLEHHEVGPSTFFMIPAAVYLSRASFTLMRFATGTLWIGI